MKPPFPGRQLIIFFQPPTQKWAYKVDGEAPGRQSPWCHRFQHSLRNCCFSPYSTRSTDPILCVSKWRNETVTSNSSSSWPHQPPHRSGCYLRLRSIKCFVFFLVEVGPEGGCCWNRWSIWVCILSDSSVTKACGRESGGGIYWAALWGITFPIMEPRVNNKNVVLAGETSVTEVINIFACGGYKLKKRIQFTHSKAIFSVISAPSLLPLFSPPDQWFFVNKSLSSCPQRLIKEQHRRTKTREVTTLLIAERHFALPWKTKEKWRRRALLFFCVYAFMDTHQVCRSR